MQIEPAVAGPPPRWSRSLKRVSFSLFLLSSTFALGSPVYRANLSQFVSDSWNREKGLPQNAVAAMEQTQDGYLWLATRAGLVRFDGVRAKLFDGAGIPGLGTDVIAKLKVDSDGALWAAPQSPGLFRYDGVRWSRLGAESGLPSGPIKELQKGPTGKLWATPTEGGLLEWNGKKFCPVPTPKPLPPSAVLRVLHASDGAIWLGFAQDGLIRWQGSDWRIYGTKQGLFASSVFGLAESSNGTIWVGGYLGIQAIVNGKFNPKLTLAAAKGKEVEFSLQVSPDEIWWGTRESGVLRYKDGEVEILTAGPMLYDDRIRSGLIDAEGSIWLGTQHGLNRLHPPRILFFGDYEGFYSERAERALLTPSGKIVQINENGSLELGLGTERQRIGVHPLPNRNQDLIGISKDQTIWLRDSQNAFFAVRNGRYVRQNFPPGENAVVFLETSSGDQLVGTFGGRLLSGAGDKWTYVPHPFPLSGARITVLAEGQDKTLWVGTEAHGLASYSRGLWRVWKKDFGSLAKDILSLHCDMQGRVWAGTNSGIVLIENGKLHFINKSTGSQDEIITALAIDKSGNLWAAGLDGIVRIPAEELNKLSEGPNAPLKSQIFAARDGLRFPEALAFAPSSVSADGTVSFLMARGLAQIVPDMVWVNQQAPKTQIEEVLLDGVPLPPSASIQMPARSTRVEFRFTALSLLQPERISFRYRMLGYDKEWVESDKVRSAVYSGLRGGKYEFQVLSTNGDGVSSHIPATVVIEKKKRFSEAAWFPFLMPTLVGSIAYAGYRIRTMQLRAKHHLVLAERQRIARELHDGLLQEFNGATLKLAAIQIKCAGNEVGADLDRVVDGLEQSLTESRQAIQTLRGREWEGVRLYSALQECAEGMCRPTQVKIQCMESGSYDEPGTDVKEAFWQIAREAIRNSLKHGNPTQIRLELAVDKNDLILSVDDDGRGFDPHKAAPNQGTRFGLSGLKERAKRVGGSLQIESAAGGGCRLRFRISIRESQSRVINVLRNAAKATSRWRVALDQVDKG
ncbi:MAG: hypothetical protein H7039_01690 [Bryobacteraceae bacterium]|nr:hypothetical protein [Bryobacteraceae bacterium]